MGCPASPETGNLYMEEVESRALISFVWCILCIFVDRGTFSHAVRNVCIYFRYMCVYIYFFVCIYLCFCVYIFMFMCAFCVYLYTEVPSASRSEEEAGGEVWDGRPDCSAAHLYCLVSIALHVAHQVRSRSCQPTTRRLFDHHTGRLPGNLTCTDTPVLMHFYNSAVLT